MKFSVEKKDRYCIFKPNEARLLSLNAPNLKSELVLLNAEGFKNIVVDLSEVEFIDSSGLSAVIKGERLCKDSKGTYVLCNVSEYVEKLIKISRLDSILNLVPTVKEAVDLVMMEELERDLKGE